VVRLPRRARSRRPRPVRRSRGNGGRAEDLRGPDRLLSQQTGPWADLLNPLPKFVASRTLRGPLEWNATALEGDAADAVSRLKGELEGDLLLIGCGELACHLLAHDVVDELRLAVWGEGERRYPGESVRMRLLDSTSYDSGVTQLRYEPLGRAR
jgi:dihydrofolate reductase